MASSNIPSDTSTTRTLRDSDTFSEIETESTTVGHGSRASFGDKLEKLEVDGYIAKPEMSVGREEIGFAKSRRISYNSNETAPPPYTESPSYSLSFARAGRGDRYHEHTYEHEHEYEHEPRTLSMYLFFLGFLCPLFWIIGTFTLRLPHTETERRLGGRLDPFRIWGLSSEEKAEAEREVERLIRRWEVEWRWGKRCMWAAIVFVAAGLVVGMAVWGGLSMRRN